MGGGEIQPVGVVFGHGQCQQLRQPDDVFHRLGIAPGLGETQKGIVRLDQPLGGPAGVGRVGPSRPRHSHQVQSGEPGATGQGQHGRLPGDCEVHRAFGLAHGHLKQTANHEPGVVLVLQTVVHLGVLPHDFALVPWLLHPLDASFPATDHAAGKSPWPCTRGHQHRIGPPPGGVDGSAIVQGAHVYVNCGSRRVARYHSIACCGVQGYSFVGDRDQSGRGPLSFIGLGHGFLPESDL